MTNYENIREAIAKKLMQAEATFDKYSDAVDLTSKKVDDLEQRYINGENVDEILDKAYDEHNATFDKYNSAQIILKHYKKAQKLYEDVMYLIEEANYIEANYL